MLFSFHAGDFPQNSKFGPPNHIPKRRKFEKFLRKIMSVGFLPLGEIRNAIVDLQDEEPIWTLFFRYPELRDFFQYFHKTWFSTFPPEMWNIFERPSRMRLTNICEGCNSSWNRRTRRGRPSFWLAIRSLKVQERVVKNIVNRMQAGEMPPRQRQKWRTLKALKNSLTSGNRSVMNFCKVVSYVCISI